MLNNMVSPTDHVVMNHQNYTQTNGIWGHVRHNIQAYRGKLWIESSVMIDKLGWL
jgi:hypothetical protein